MNECYTWYNSTSIYCVIVLCKYIALLYINIGPFVIEVFCNLYHLIEI